MVIAQKPARTNTGLAAPFENFCVLFRGVPFTAIDNSAMGQDRIACHQSMSATPDVRLALVPGSRSFPSKVADCVSLGRPIAPGEFQKGSPRAFFEPTGIRIKCCVPIRPFVPCVPIYPSPFAPQESRTTFPTRLVATWHGGKKISNASKSCATSPMVAAHSSPSLSAGWRPAFRGPKFKCGIAPNLSHAIFARGADVGLGCCQ